MAAARATAWLAIGAWLLAAGCYFLRYDALCRTHVEVLTSMAGKRRDLIVARIPDRDDGEFRYPLERARDFARIVEGRFGERDSHRRLVQLIARYEKGLEGEEKDGAEVTAAEVSALGREVIASLDAEA